MKLEHRHKKYKYSTWNKREEKGTKKSFSSHLPASFSKIPSEKTSPALNQDIIVPRLQHLGILSKHIPGGEKHESSQEFQTTLKFEIKKDLPIGTD